MSLVEWRCPACREWFRVERTCDLYTVAEQHITDEHPGWPGLVVEEPDHSRWQDNGGANP